MAGRLAKISIMTAAAVVPTLLITTLTHEVVLLDGKQGDVGQNFWKHAYTY